MQKTNIKDNFMFIGIDVGGTNIKIGLCDINGNIVAKAFFKTNRDREYSDVLDEIEEYTYNLIKNHKALNKIQGIGIGIPGITDTENGIVSSATNIGWFNLPLVDEMNKRFIKRIGNVPVRIANDANCAALGEYRFGKDIQCDNMILVTIGTGIGSGFILDKKLFIGGGGAGAEAGHITIKTGGDLCNCGKMGCWERYASASALVRLTENKIAQKPSEVISRLIESSGKINGRTAFDAMRQGDEIGKEIVNEYIEYLSVGIINLINLFHPEIILIGGGVSNEKEYLTKPLQDIVDDYIVRSNFYPLVKIKTATLGNDAGLLGAAALNM